MLTVAEVVKATNGTLLNPELVVGDIQTITTDSRKIMVQGLFIPLKGDRFDGHDFIATVYDKGAVATLTMTKEVKDNRLATILVNDTRKALLDLARYYRLKFTIPVIGITGSVGKTSTKEMIAATLSGKWHVHKTEGNFNNEIGLPLTLFELDSTDEVAVIEMGMNHFGEIHNLTTTALPDVAVITNIGSSHIENLGSREGILKAKLEIIDGMKPEGLLILNGDNDLLKTVGQLPVHCVTYGLEETNDYRATHIQIKEMATWADIITPHEMYQICIPALGEHMVYNTLAAIAVAEHYGYKKEDIQKGLSTYKPAKMRMQITELENQIMILDDTYNASPDAMKAALKVLMSISGKGRKIAVLGDMFELGEFAPQLHKEVGEFARDIELDELIGVGNLAKYMIEGYCKTGQKDAIYFETKEQFIDQLSTLFKANDCILFKASRGMHFESLIQAMGKVSEDE